MCQNSELDGCHMKMNSGWWLGMIYQHISSKMDVKDGLVPDMSVFFMTTDTTIAFKNTTHN